MSEVAIYLGDSSENFPVEFSLNSKAEEYFTVTPVIVKPYTGVSLTVFQWSEFYNQPIIISHDFDYLFKVMLFTTPLIPESVNVFGSLDILHERIVRNYCKERGISLKDHNGTLVNQ